MRQNSTLLYRLILEMVVVFPSSFVSKIIPFNMHSPAATLYLSGKEVTNLLSDASMSIPITEFFGPVIPISVIKPVPKEVICSSAV